MMMTTHPTTFTNNEHDIWYLDSGAMSHMTCHQEYLYNYCELPPYTIILGNNIVITIAGMGNIHRTICTNSVVNIVMLTNVLHILQVVKNLISPNRIVELGYIFIQDCHSCRIIHQTTRDLFLHATSQDGMLHVPLEVLPITLSTPQQVNTFSLLVNFSL